MGSKSDILSIELDTARGQSPSSPLHRERQRALKDLSLNSCFKIKNNKNNPYRIKVGVHAGKLTFCINGQGQDTAQTIILSLSPYKRIIKDYFMMIDSYEAMRGQSTAAKLETVDMARRGLHNEAAELMIERLKDKIEMDHETARNLFTLICVLQIESATRP